MKGLNISTFVQYQASKIFSATRCANSRRVLLALQGKRSILDSTVIKRVLLAGLAISGKVLLRRQAVAIGFNCLPIGETGRKPTSAICGERLLSPRDGFIFLGYDRFIPSQSQNLATLPLHAHQEMPHRPATESTLYEMDGVGLDPQHRASEG